jgi:hypothetical protein
MGGGGVNPNLWTVPLNKVVAVPFSDCMALPRVMQRETAAWCPPMPCGLMGRPKSPRLTGGPPSLGNTTGEVSCGVVAAGTQRGAAVLEHGSSKG